MCSVNQQASSKEVQFFIDVGFVFFLFPINYNPNVSFLADDPNGTNIFFKSDISKHKNPSRAYQIRPDEAPVVSRHQGSPPSVALSVMLVDYSLDCKGLKGRD